MSQRTGTAAPCPHSGLQTRSESRHVALYPSSTVCGQLPVLQGTAVDWLTCRMTHTACPAGPGHAQVPAGQDITRVTNSSDLSKSFPGLTTKAAHPKKALGS